MSKIYDLYSPDQRKIDNLKRRIRGYQKMEKDLNRDIRKTNNKNRELQKRIDTYENPEDLTLMFMYCEEKAKDKINKLEKENRKLNNILNIIEQHCLDEQMPEEYLEYSAFVEVQNMVYEGIYEKIQELKGDNNE